MQNDVNDKPPSLPQLAELTQALPSAPADIEALTPALMARALRRLAEAGDQALVSPAERAAAAKDLANAYARNTQKMWASNWNVWRKFCAASGHKTFPMTLTVIRAFLEDLVDRGRKRATIEQYLATFAWIHRLAKRASPLDTFEGELLVKSLRRDKRLPKAQRQARPLGRADLLKILAPLDPNKEDDVRDAALLCVAYDTLMRSAELAAMDVVDVFPGDSEDPNGTALLPYSKTDREGEGQERFLGADTLERIRRWRAIASVREGPLWRVSASNPKAELRGRPLKARDIARIFQRRAERAGVYSKGELRFSAHSTRVGAAQDLATAGMTDLEIQREGGWQSSRMVARYTRRTKTRRGAMAKLRARQITKETGSPD